MTRLVVGVDGGGTSVRAVVLDADGQEIARVEGPGAVVTEAQASLAADSVTEVVQRAAHQAGVEFPVAALWAGLAGAGRKAARSAVERKLAGRGLADRLAVGTDVDAAFRSVFDQGSGLILIAGTGSVALGRDREGRHARVGGWGERLGDEGGGWWIGRQALGSLTRAVDGRGPATSLTDVLLTAAGLSDPRALVRWADGASKADIAALAPAVVREGEAGDSVAAAIVGDALVALRSHVLALLEHGEFEAGGLRLALSGGLIAAGGALRTRFLAALDPVDIEVVETDPDPGRGAARYALDLLSDSDD